MFAMKVKLITFFYTKGRWVNTQQKGESKMVQAESYQPINAKKAINQGQGTGPKQAIDLTVGLIGKSMGGSTGKSLEWPINRGNLGKRLSKVAGLGALALSLLTTLPANAQRNPQFELDRAICANNWDEAIRVVGTLVASGDTEQSQRASLLSLRRQLERYRSENVIVMAEQACDRTDPYLLTTTSSPEQPPQALGWERAVTEATNNQFSTSVITESAPLTLPVNIDGPLGLSPAAPIDLSQGLNVVSGHVGPGHEVYGFVAGLGDRLDANLQVTRVMTGSLYTSDDSQLFIFDRQGNLIAKADDSNDNQQSRISNIVLPRTDLYYAVVTSYNNDPILHADGRLAGWQDNGGGRFDYTLTLSGVTPTQSLLR
jgi:hypothetical protein